MGGETDYGGESFETYTWAAGLAALTSNITITATSHVPVMHPTYAAKAGATIDHISDGRFAVNLVMGWYSPELAQFGIVPEAHDVRYSHGQEWVDVVKRLWEEDGPVTHEGKWFSVQEARLRPKPLEEPLLLNAGTSPAGVEFCVRNCHFNLASNTDVDAVSAHVGRVKSLARDEYARDVGVINLGFVLCDDSQSGAERRMKAILDAGDWEGALNMLRYIGLNVESYPDTTLRSFQENMIQTGGSFPLVGTPENIASQIEELADAGIDGLALSFLNYREELQQFNETVVPLLVNAGLRERGSTAGSASSGS
jgi:FMNH2-dependent dimethyl sulfone monooxygenase